MQRDHLCNTFNGILLLHHIYKQSPLDIISYHGLLNKCRSLSQWHSSWVSVSKIIVSEALCQGLFNAIQVVDRKKCSIMHYSFEVKHMLYFPISYKGHPLGTETHLITPVSSSLWSNPKWRKLTLNSLQNGGHFISVPIWMYWITNSTR